MRPPVPPPVLTTERLSWKKTTVISLATELRVQFIVSNIYLSGEVFHWYAGIEIAEWWPAEEEQNRKLCPNEWCSLKHEPVLKQLFTMKSALFRSCTAA